MMKIDQKISELHKVFLDKYEELSLPEINQMVDILTSKKIRLEKVGGCCCC